MRNFLRWIHQSAWQWGLDLPRFFLALMHAPRYLAEGLIFWSRSWGQGLPFRWGRPLACLADRGAPGGEARGHYFHQDLWAAQRIFQNQPQKHVDVGSRVDGFVAHVAAFREIEVLDLRPLESHVQNLRFGQADLMAPMWSLDQYCDSVSCLSVLEHLGLGRYGDRLDPKGYLIGWERLHRMLKPGGKLYFSVPIGPARIEFNAHRVFAVSDLLDLMGAHYRLDQMAYVDDQGALHLVTQRNPAAEARNFSCHFGCGLFELTKMK